MAIQDRALNSSAIQHILFDFETGDLWIVFNKRKVYPTYHYEGVPPEVIVDFLNASSAGSFFHSHIDGNYQSATLRGPSVNTRIGNRLEALRQEDINRTGKWR
jgi:hypothetical protein